MFDFLCVTKLFAPNKKVNNNKAIGIQKQLKIAFFFFCFHKKIPCVLYDRSVARSKSQVPHRALPAQLFSLCSINDVGRKLASMVLSPPGLWQDRAAYAVRGIDVYDIPATLRYRVTFILFLPQTVKQQSNLFIAVTRTYSSLAQPGHRPLQSTSQDRPPTTLTRPGRRTTVDATERGDRIANDTRTY